MSNKILVVDDETEIADLIEVYLKNENYTVFKFYTAQEALNCIETTPIDLAILDIMLPDIDGFTLCKKIREHHTYPIIMLTAKDAETDKITGLTLGADDYITKPFRPLEMIARVKSQLRRYQKYNPAHSDTGETSSAASEDNLVYGSLTMNIKAHTCFLGETPLVLTPTEFSILRILLENTVQKICFTKSGRTSITANPTTPSPFISATCGRNWEIAWTSPDSLRRYGG